jgi:hypothetical protein
MKQYLILPFILFLFTGTIKQERTSDEIRPKSKTIKPGLRNYLNEDNLGIPVQYQGLKAKRHAAGAR